MVLARQFLNTGIKKVLILLLLHSFLQEFLFLSLSPYRRFPSYCFPSNAIQVTVPRTMLQRYNAPVCNFCHGKCLFWSCLTNRVLHSRHHFRHKYQLFRKEDKVLVTNVFSASKQLFLFVNDQHCNVRMPHLWASYPEASASL